MLKKIFILSITLLLCNSICYTPIAYSLTVEQEVKELIKTKFNLDFSEKNVLILNDIPLNKNLVIKGYSFREPNEKASIKASELDLIKNYAAFIKGWNYELNNNNLRLIFDDNLKIKNIVTKPISENIFSSESNLNLNDKFISSFSNYPSVFVYSKVDIKDNSNPLTAFIEAKNKAIALGLSEYYSGKEQNNIKGKIYLQDIIYNSLDNINPFQTEIIYILRFTVQEY